MSEHPLDEQECQQDMLRRTHKWLAMLEERIIMLLHAHEPETLKPGECEQAISRYLMMIVRLLQLRQQYATHATSGENALLDALLHDMNDTHHAE